MIHETVGADTNIYSITPRITTTYPYSLTFALQNYNYPVSSSVAFIHYLQYS